MQPMQKPKNVSFTLADGVLAQLQKSAKQDGRSLSGQIRYLLALAVTRRGTMKGAK